MKNTLMAFMLSINLIVMPVMANDIGYVYKDQRQNENKLYVPASVIKILTAFLALKQYGNDHRFKTSFYKDGEGLILLPEGDPFFTGEDIGRIADSFIAKGINTVPYITVDVSRSQAGYNYDDGDSTDNPYNSPTAALVLNFNTVTYGNGLVQGEEHTPLVPISKALYKPEVKRASLMTADNAITYYIQVFDAIFKSKGIQVGEWRTDTTMGISDPSLTPVLVYESSKTLEEIITAMLEFSNNSIANQLAVNLVYDNYHKPVNQTGIEVYYESRLKELVGDDITGSVISDGSGLSRKSKITPTLMLKIVEAFKPYKELMKEGKEIKTGTMKGIRNEVGFKGEEPFVLLCNDCDNSFDRDKFVADNFN